MNPTFNAKVVGPSFIAFAAILWATDALFRFPLLQKLDALWIVFGEHTLILIALLPWAIKNRSVLFKLSINEWIAAFLIGVGGSALATLLFTASFRYINPSIAILLQKFQPVLTAILASLILKDQLSKTFYFWAAIAVGAGVVISFPTLDFNFLTPSLDLHSKGVLYAFTATCLWAISTIAGKSLLNRIPPIHTTFWRFFFGWIALTVVLLLTSDIIPINSLFKQSTLISLGYMGLVPGLFAVFLFYQGLKRTKASIATFVELVFPVAAIALNTFILNLPLEMTQIIAGGGLLLAVMFISNEST